MQAAFFLEGPRGRLFCTGSLSGDAGRPAVLMLPAFAEEMNKSRHVMAALSRELAKAGFDTLLPDPLGTGDSAGDFGDANIDIWREDIDAAIAHLGPRAELHLLGLRTGALLAADAVSRHAAASLTLLHPQASGSQQLNHLLRLRLAGELLTGQRPETSKDLKERLANGESLEIAGYRLSATMAEQLETLTLSSMPPSEDTQVNWIEVAPEAGRPLLPVSHRVIESWQDAGVKVRSSVVVGDAFWSTQEIAHCPALIERTRASLAG